MGGGVVIKVLVVAVHLQMPTWPTGWRGAGRTQFKVEMGHPDQPLACVLTPQSPVLCVFYTTTFDRLIHT
jgi:hypothetical protein